MVNLKTHVKWFAALSARFFLLTHLDYSGFVKSKISIRIPAFKGVHGVKGFTFNRFVISLLCFVKYPTSFFGIQPFFVSQTSKYFNSILRAISSVLLIMLDSAIISLSISPHVFSTFRKTPFGMTISPRTEKLSTFCRTVFLNGTNGLELFITIRTNHLSPPSLLYDGTTINYKRVR